MCKNRNGFPQLKSPHSPVSPLAGAKLPKSHSNGSGKVVERAIKSCKICKLRKGCLQWIVEGCLVFSVRYGKITIN